VVVNGSTIVDVAFLGHLGQNPLAAYAKVVVWLRIFDVIIRAMCSGIAILGGKDMQHKNKGIVRAARWLSRGIILGGVVGIIAMVAQYYMGDLVKWQTDLTVSLTSEVQELATSYGHIILWAVPAHLLTIALWDFSSISVHGGHSIQVVSSLVALVLGIVFNYLFIFQDILARWDHSLKGFQGSPVATVCTTWAKLLMTLLVMSLFFFCREHERSTTSTSVWQAMRESFCSEDMNRTMDGEFKCGKWFHEMWDYLKNCLQKLLGMGLQSLFFITVLVIASNEPSFDILLHPPQPPAANKIISESTAKVWDNHFGAHIKNHALIPSEVKQVHKQFQNVAAGSALALASLICLLTFYQLPIAIFNAIGVACSNRVAVALVQEDERDSHTMGYYTIMISLVIALIIAIPFVVAFAGPEFLAYLFTQDDAITQELGKIDRWLAIVVALDAVTIVICHGVFPEIQRTNWIWQHRIAFGVLFAPFAWLFVFELKYGNEGLLYAWIIASGVTCTSCCVLLYMVMQPDKWCNIRGAVRVQMAARRAAQHEQAEPVVEDASVSSFSFNAHVVKMTKGEEDLAPDYIQLQRDTPHMLSIRAAGGTF